MSALVSPVLALFNLGTTELVVVFLIILLLFGGAKLPGLAKGLGQSIREFKKSSKEESPDEKTKTTDAPKADASKTTPGNN